MPVEHLFLNRYTSSKMGSFKASSILPYNYVITQCNNKNTLQACTVVWEKFNMREFSSDTRYDKY